MLRTAETADAEAIARVHVVSWQSIYRGHFPDDFLAGLSVERRAQSWRTILTEQPGSVAVWQSDGTVTGFVSIGLSRDADAPPGTGELMAIYLDPGNWRQGVGGRLMNWTIDEACRHGWHTMTLWVLRENRQARAFYQAYGWQSDGATQKATIGGVEITELRYRRICI